MYALFQQKSKSTPWNKGKLVGQKVPLKLKEIWDIRIHLQIGREYRDLALFNLAIDSKLRACDLLKLKVSDVSHGTEVAYRAMVMQQKTGQPVQLEITEQTRQSVSEWIRRANLGPADYLFRSRIHQSAHLSTRQYARIVESWVTSIGLCPITYGTHSLRRTKASLIYKRTKNLRAVQLLLGHTKLESTVRYLGIEVDDALEMAEQTEVYGLAAVSRRPLSCRSSLRGPQAPNDPKAKFAVVWQYVVNGYPGGAKVTYSEGDVLARAGNRFPRTR